MKQQHKNCTLSVLSCRKVHTCSGVDQKLVIYKYITNIVINKYKQNAPLRDGMMQFETCSHKVINSQGLTDNLKLISIHSKPFEVRQLSTKRNSQLTNYELTNVKLKQCLGCSAGGGNMCFNGSALLRSNEDWFRSVLQVHTRFKHCRKSSCRLKF